ncbi:hypothetical protein P3T24_006038 [Paraburkholderia sp. GAS33]|jgi:hypothetical protein
MSIESPFETDAQFAETGKPGMCAFDHPAMTAEPFAALDTTTRNACRDASLLQ